MTFLLIYRPLLNHLYAENLEQLHIFSFSCLLKTTVFRLSNVILKDREIPHAQVQKLLHQCLFFLASVTLFPMGPIFIWEISDWISSVWNTAGKVDNIFRQKGTSALDEESFETIENCSYHHPPTLGIIVRTSNHVLGRASNIQIC